MGLKPTAFALARSVPGFLKTPLRSCESAILPRKSKFNSTSIKFDQIRSFSVFCDKFWAFLGIKHIGGWVMEFIEVKIRKFSTLIKRSDIKSPTWFAMEHNVLLHPDFFDVDGDEFKAFVWIAGVAAHLNSDSIRVYSDVCASQIRISKKSVKSCIEKLSGKRWDVTVQSRECTGNFDEASATVQYSTVQDTTEHNSTNKTISAESNESITRRSKSALVKFESLDELLSEFDEKTLEAWGELYDDAVYFRRQCIKAWDYYRTNGSKRPKNMSGWKRALNHWLENDWAKHVKNIEGKAPGFGGKIEDILGGVS